MFHTQRSTVNTMKVEYHVKTLSFPTTMSREPPNLRLTRSKSPADSLRRPQHLRLCARWTGCPQDDPLRDIPHLYVCAWPLRRKQDCTHAREEPNGKPQTTCGSGQGCRSGSYRGESHTYLPHVVSALSLGSEDKN